MADALREGELDPGLAHDLRRVSDALDERLTGVREASGTPANLGARGIDADRGPAARRVSRDNSSALASRLRNGADARAGRPLAGGGRRHPAQALRAARRPRGRTRVGRRLPAVIVPARWPPVRIPGYFSAPLRARPRRAPLEASAAAQDRSRVRRAPRFRQGAADRSGQLHREGSSLDRRRRQAATPHRGWTLDPSSTSSAARSRLDRASAGTQGPMRSQRHQLVAIASISWNRARARPATA